MRKIQRKIITVSVLICDKDTHDVIYEDGEGGGGQRRQFAPGPQRSRGPKNCLGHFLGGL